LLFFCWGRGGGGGGGAGAGGGRGRGHLTAADTPAPHASGFHDLL
jgi:hypothetical protein